ncbi:MAG: hypothetical protein K2J80_04105 [Oscillospiraceae bacterium]|nr:hypothetical protein [Oscillospiraceae bacterium]
MVVSLFGHKNTPSSVKPFLEKTVRRLIEENKEITFLVGTHGAFDLMAQEVLKQAIERYPRITCHIVLAYIPVDGNAKRYALPTLVPEGIESVPKKFAISYRNDYMVKECDTVICYITHDWGGAAQFVDKARHKGKNIINLVDF